MGVSNDWFYVVTDRGDVLVAKHAFIESNPSPNPNAAPMDALHASYTLTSRPEKHVIELVAAMSSALHYWASTQTSTITTPPGRVGHHVVFMGSLGKHDVLGLPATVFSIRDEMIDSSVLMELLSARVSTRSFRAAAGRDHDRLCLALRNTVATNKALYLHPEVIH